MNLDLPFQVMDPAELDALLAEVDRRLDALFLGELESAFDAKAALPAELTAHAQAAA